MVNELKKWWYRKTAKNMVEVLRNKHFDAIYADNLQEAKKIVLDMIPEGSSVAAGGSVTLNQLDLIEEFRKPKYKFFERYNQPSFAEIWEVYRQSLLADVLVTSTNAITKNGELVNTDCSGNRVAGMIFGPNKVIIIAGVNKVVEDIDAAMKRMKEIAPLNSKRIGHQTPCIETGYCVDCKVHARICNYITIINHGMKIKDRISVIMVAEEAGF